MKILLLSIWLPVAVFSDQSSLVGEWEASQIKTRLHLQENGSFVLSYRSLVPDSLDSLGLEIEVLYEGTWSATDAGLTLSVDRVDAILHNIEAVVESLAQAYEAGTGETADREAIRQELENSLLEDIDRQPGEITTTYRLENGRLWFEGEWFTRRAGQTHVERSTWAKVKKDVQLSP